MTKSRYTAFRSTPSERAALEKLRDSYGLKSLSEAARRAIRQVAVERGLLEAQGQGIDRTSEVKEHE